MLRRGTTWDNRGCRQIRNPRTGLRPYAPLSDADISPSFQRRNGTNFTLFSKNLCHVLNTNRRPSGSMSLPSGRASTAEPRRVNRESFCTISKQTGLIGVLSQDTGNRLRLARSLCFPPKRLSRRILGLPLKIRLRKHATRSIAPQARQGCKRVLNRRMVARPPIRGFRFHLRPRLSHVVHLRSTCSDEQNERTLVNCF